MTEHDRFIETEVAKLLTSDEQVLNTAYMVKQPDLIWQFFILGGLLVLLMTKAYYVVVTNQRIIKIRTKMGFFKPAMASRGVEEIPLLHVMRVSTSGFANNRSMTFHLRDGSKERLRISPRLKLVTGQRAFFTEVPERLTPKSVAA